MEMELFTPKTKFCLHTVQETKNAIRTATTEVRLNAIDFYTWDPVPMPWMPHLHGMTVTGGRLGFVKS